MEGRAPVGSGILRACCCNAAPVVDPCTSAYPYLFPKYIKLKMPDEIRIPDYIASQQGFCEPDVEKVHRTQWVPDYLYLECDGPYWGTYKGFTAMFGQWGFGAEGSYLPSATSAARYKIYGTTSDENCTATVQRDYFDAIVFCGWIPLRGSACYLDDCASEVEPVHMQCSDGTYGLFRPFTCLRIKLKAFHFKNSQFYNYDLVLDAFAWLSGSNVTSNDVCVEMEALPEHSVSGGCSAVAWNTSDPEWDDPYPCEPFGNRDLTLVSLWVPEYEQIPCPPNLLYPSLTGHGSDILGGATNRYHTEFARWQSNPFTDPNNPIYQDCFQAWTWGFLPASTEYMGPSGFTSNLLATADAQCAMSGYMKSSYDMDLYRLRSFCGHGPLLEQAVADNFISESVGSEMRAWGLPADYNIVSTTLTPGKELVFGGYFCPLQVAYADLTEYIGEWP